MPQDLPPNRQPESGPPDLLELIAKFFGSGKKSSSNYSSSNNSAPGLGKFVAWIVGILVVLWVLLGITIIAPAQQGVVLTFGRYHETLNSGPHWLPPLIDKVYKVNVRKIYNFTSQQQMLTEDENIVLATIAVQYRIKNALDYLFENSDPEASIRQATTSALRQVIGDNTLNYALTVGRQTIAKDVQTQLTKILSGYKTGLSVTDVTLQSVVPPEQVTAAFDDATKAREDQQSYINQAQAYARKVESIVTGQTARLMQSAQAYQQQTVLQAKGDTARYLALLHAYQQSPTITYDRLYFDAMNEVLGKTRTIVVDGKQGNLMYLPLKFMGVSS